MRGVDADDRHAGTGDRAARHRHVEGEGTGAADGARAVERRVHVVERVHPQEALREVVVDFPAAVLGDGADGLLELGKALAGADLDGH